MSQVPAGPDTEHLERLLRSAKSMQTSSWSSLFMMLIGISVIGMSAFYSYTQLAPLEEKIKRSKQDLAALDQKLMQKQQELDHLSQLATDMQAEDLKTRLELRKNLRQTQSILSNIVPGSAAGVAQLDSVKEYLGTAQSDLTPPEGTAVAGDFEAALAATFSDNSVERISAFDKLVSAVEAKPERMAKVTDYALSHLQKENGVYNVLVLANVVSSKTLAAASPEIRRLLDGIKTPGAKTKKLMAQVQRRLPTGVPLRSRGTSR